MIYQICVGGCPIGIFCNEKNVENMIEAVSVTYPTQDVSARLYEEIEIIETPSEGMMVA